MHLQETSLPLSHRCHINEVCRLACYYPFDFIYLFVFNKKYTLWLFPLYCLVSLLSNGPPGWGRVTTEAPIRCLKNRDYLSLPVCAVLCCLRARLKSKVVNCRKGGDLVQPPHLKGERAEVQRGYVEVCKFLFSVPPFTF